MHLCRCPHCRSTFQVSIPEESKAWETTPTDEDGMLLWVCLDCHRQGRSPVTEDDVRTFGHDTSFRREQASHQ